MFCIKCGKEVGTDLQFCTHCGNKISPEHITSKGRKIHPWFVISFLIILVLMGYWFCYRPYQDTKVCIQQALSQANKVDGDQTDAHYFFWKCQKEHGVAD